MSDIDGQIEELMKPISDNLNSKQLGGIITDNWKAYNIMSANKVKLKFKTDKGKILYFDLYPDEPLILLKFHYKIKNKSSKKSKEWEGKIDRSKIFLWNSRSDKHGIEVSEFDTIEKLKQKTSLGDKDDIRFYFQFEDPQEDKKGKLTHEALGNEDAIDQLNTMTKDEHFDPVVEMTVGGRKRRRKKKRKKKKAFPSRKKKHQKNGTKKKARKH